MQYFINLSFFLILSGDTVFIQNIASLIFAVNFRKVILKTVQKIGYFWKFVAQLSEIFEKVTVFTCIYRFSPPLQRICWFSRLLTMIVSFWSSINRNLAQDSMNCSHNKYHRIWKSLLYKINSWVLQGAKLGLRGFQWSSKQKEQKK